MEAEILRLPDALLARYLKLSDLMLQYGANLGMPHTKPVGKGLFELRLKGKEGIARVFYCTKIGKKIYILHSFIKSFIKKSQQTPSKELKIAQKRMKEVTEND